MEAIASPRTRRRSRAFRVPFQAGFWALGLAFSAHPQASSLPRKARTLAWFVSAPSRSWRFFDFICHNHDRQSAGRSRFTLQQGVVGANRDGPRRAFLSDKDTRKAVDILEEQLPKVNGNPEYLTLLRDAYRVYVRDLYLSGQPEQAKRYLDRLCILDPGAANDVTLRPAVASPPRKFDPEPVKEAKLAFPNWNKLNPFAKKVDSKPAAEPQTVIRALPEESISVDPFDCANRREMASDATNQTLARDLLSRATWNSRTNAMPTPANISSKRSGRTRLASMRAASNGRIASSRA